MRYFITFLEGIVTFISPCVLPMIPIYIMYFAGGTAENKTKKALLNAVGFVLGFSAFFILLGVFAGSIGKILIMYSTAVNIITGTVVVFFGLHYMGVVKISFLNKTVKPKSEIKPQGFFSCLLFGIVFSIGWSPCTGAFLGSAIMLAANEQSAFQGMLLLLCYSAGLGIPFVICAVLIDKLKSTFSFIKSHYKAVNIASGVFLVVTGILMATGILTKIMRILR